MTTDSDVTPEPTPERPAGALPGAPGAGTAGPAEPPAPPGAPPGIPGPSAAHADEPAETRAPATGPHAVKPAPAPATTPEPITAPEATTGVPDTPPGCPVTHVDAPQPGTAPDTSPETALPGVLGDGAAESPETPPGAPGIAADCPVTHVDTDSPPSCPVTHVNAPQPATAPDTPPETALPGVGVLGNEPAAAPEPMAGALGALGAPGGPPVLPAGPFGEGPAALHRRPPAGDPAGDPPEAGLPLAEGDPLGGLARALSEAAGVVRDVARAVTAVATDPALLASVGRSPVRGARALRAVARTLLDPAGLGYAPDGGRLGRAAWVGGVLTSRPNLAVDVAVTALKLRIRLCAARHPEFVEEGPVRRMLIAIEADRQTLALRILRQNVRAQGAQRALAALAPCLTEVMAWNALVDENPFNDEAAWCIVKGTRADGDPLLGTRIATWARWDRGPGRAEVLPPDPGFLAGLDDSGSVSGHLRNLAALGNDGRTLVQRVTGPDGITRYLMLLPGMAFGLPRNPTPQDLVGAVTAVGRNDSPYTRAARKALAQAVPVGAEVALIGHSQGGVAAMNLAELPAVNERWRLTHVVAVGAPIDFKRPLDPRTRVVSLVNEHDVVPNLEGRSPVSVFPVPADWLEITWVDPTHDFPQCHNVDVYAQSLDKIVPEARDKVDDLLTPFRGLVEETVVHRLHDR
ncbi:hypothetical protein GCM10009544_59170 [Streptomyces stramineus]|uniref:Fungal lipase-like domain-containing protein n=1 Tax=Streptomyces stramineus TaxID=173861 RepID=A0ABN1B553_9ACTN